MAATRSGRASRFDPFKNFKFRLVWSGRTAGGFNALAPARIMKITGMNKSTDVTLKRGVIGAPALMDWLNKVRGGGAAAEHRDLAIEQTDGGGRKSAAVALVRCRVLDVAAMPDLDASANTVAVTMLKLRCKAVRQKFPPPSRTRRRPAAKR